MSRRNKERKETFPKIDPSSASNEALLDELLRASNSDDWATSDAQIRHYEEYSAELKAEVIRRMAK